MSALKSSFLSTTHEALEVLQLKGPSQLQARGETTSEVERRTKGGREGRREGRVEGEEEEGMMNEHGHNLHKKL